MVELQSIFKGNSRPSHNATDVDFGFFSIPVEVYHAKISS